MQRITPHLWFDSQAEEAANFYVDIFSRIGRLSKVTMVARYSKEGAAAAGRLEGSAMTVVFELDGQKFLALNGGPILKFTEAVSFVIECETQEEVDHFWNALAEGGDEKAQQCGWLKDKYGLSWQVIPTILPKLMSDPVKAGRVMAAMLHMKKISIAGLEEAAQ